MSRVVRALTFASLALVCASGCRALLDLPEVGNDLASDDAGRLAETAPPAPPADTGVQPATCTTVKTYMPEEGIYEYGPPGISLVDRGLEEAYKLLPDGGEPLPDAAIKREYIPSAGRNSLTASVTHVGPTSFKFRMNLTDSHYNEFLFQTTPSGGLEVVSVDDTTTGLISVQATCAPPVALLRCATVPEAGVQGATGALTFLNNPPVNFGAGVQFADLGQENVVSDGTGQTLPAFHLSETRTFTGAVSKGPQRNEYWFSQENGLLVKAKLQTGTLGSRQVDGIKIVIAQGFELEFKNYAVFTIKSKFPARLLDGGARPDASP